MLIYLGIILTKFFRKSKSVLKTGTASTLNEDS